MNLFLILRQENFHLSQFPPAPSSIIHVTHNVDHILLIATHAVKNPQNPPLHPLSDYNGLVPHDGVLNGSISPPISLSISLLMSTSIPIPILSPIPSSRVSFKNVHLFLGG